MGDTTKEIIFCVTANVLKDIQWGEEGSSKNGTKNFQGGAKVSIIDYYPDICERVVVVGHHRDNGRYIELSMAVRHLHNFRVTAVYSHKVLSYIRNRYKDERHCDKTRAKQICESVKEWAETEREKRDNSKSTR